MTTTGFLYFFSFFQEDYNKEEEQEVRRAMYDVGKLTSARPYDLPNHIC